MPLQTGDRLGPYEILTLLGAGGMGEVYRGRDTRLGRGVAIKILPERLGLAQVSPSSDTIGVGYVGRQPQAAHCRARMAAVEKLCSAECK